MSVRPTARCQRAESGLEWVKGGIARRVLWFLGVEMLTRPVSAVESLLLEELTWWVRLCGDPVNEDLDPAVDEP
jgi:hypothetical protein